MRQKFEPITRFGLAVVLTMTCIAALAVPAVAQPFQTVDHPSAGTGGSTIFIGISNGRIVGTWSDGAGAASGSFLYSNGAFTPLIHPNAATTSAFGINGNNVVGYFDDFTRTRGFVFDGVNWSDFDVPTSPPQNPSNTYPQGIDAGGTIVGLYDTGGPPHGFVRSPSGTYTTIQYPGSTDTELRAIGAAGKLIGNYTGNDGHTHGFTYANNVYTPLNYPGAADTLLIGADGNLIVGTDFDATGSEHGLLYDGATWTNFDAPGATAGTTIAGIDGTRIVGYYSDASGNHAFISSVPELSAVVFLGAAGLSLFGHSRRRRKLRPGGVVQVAERSPEIRRAGRSVPSIVLFGAILSLLSPLAGAVQIRYSFSGTANGSLGGSTFTNSAFHVIVNANTADITPLNEPGFAILSVDDEISTIQVGAFPTATFSDPLSIFDNKTNSILAWGPIDGDFFDLTNPAFGSYNLNTALGPIALIP